MSTIPRSRADLIDAASGVVADAIATAPAQAARIRKAVAGVKDAPVRLLETDLGATLDQVGSRVGVPVPDAVRDRARGVQGAAAQLSMKVLRTAGDLRQQADTAASTFTGISGLLSGLVVSVTGRGESPEVIDLTAAEASSRPRRRMSSAAVKAVPVAKSAASAAVKAAPVAKSAAVTATKAAKKAAPVAKTAAVAATKAAKTATKAASSPTAARQTSGGASATSSRTRTAASTTKAVKATTAKVAKATTAKGSAAPTSSKPAAQRSAGKVTGKAATTKPSAGSATTTSSARRATRSK